MAGRGGMLGAIDFGGTKTALALVSPGGAVLHRDRFPTPPSPAPREMADLLADRFGRLWTQAGRPPLRALGVAVPGPADPAAAVLRRAFDWGWKDVPLGALLAERLGLPIRLDNDVNCCTLAEGRFGAAVGRRDFFWLQVSTGVGGGLVLGGRLYRGGNGMAGEIGHVVLEEDGPPCACGRRGCLEALVSGPAIVRRYRASGGRAERAEEVFAAAAGGEPGAARLLAEVARDLGRAVAIAINLLDPELIVLGGGVIHGFAPYLEATRAVARARVLRQASGDPAASVPLCPTALGGDAALLGAAALAATRRPAPA